MTSHDPVGKCSGVQRTQGSHIKGSRTSFLNINYQRLPTTYPAIISAPSLTTHIPLPYYYYIPSLTTALTAPPGFQITLDTHHEEQEKTHTGQKEVTGSGPRTRETTGGDQRTKVTKTHDCLGNQSEKGHSKPPQPRRQSAFRDWQRLGGPVFTSPDDWRAAQSSDGSVTAPKATCIFASAGSDCAIGNDGGCWPTRQTSKGGKRGQSKALAAKSGGNSDRRYICACSASR